MHGKTGKKKTTENTLKIANLCIIKLTKTPREVKTPILTLFQSKIPFTAITNYSVCIVFPTIANQITTTTFDDGEHPDVQSLTLFQFYSHFKSKLM